jgi:hypothetical protein
MMKIYLVASLIIFNFFTASAQIPPKAKNIIVKNMSYAEVLSTLLDKGYTIESRDAELQTAVTTPIVYPRYWNGAYKIQVRVKDSAAYFSGVYQCPYETQFTSLLLKQPVQKGNWESVFNRTNKKGEPQKKSMDGYPFHLIDEFVKTLGKEVSYN